MWLSVASGVAPRTGKCFRKTKLSSLQQFKSLSHPFRRSATLITREISCKRNALFRSARRKVGQLSDRFGSEKQLVGWSFGILENASFRLEAQERKGKQSGFRRPVEQTRQTMPFNIETGSNGRASPVCASIVLIRGVDDPDQTGRFVDMLQMLERKMNRIQRITIDPEICHGKPVIRGLRYPVETILELLSSGMTPEDILADYEDLEREDILAVLAYATRLSQVKRIEPALV